jgi:Flp pilus assembly protein TadD
MPGDPNGQSSENGEQPQDSTDNAEAPATPHRSHLRWSWWWLFPLLIVAWLIYARLSTGHPETAATLLTKSLNEAQAHRYAECLSSAQRALKLDPKMAEAYNNAGWCAANLGHWDEGIGYIRDALRIQPDMELARSNLLWMLKERDKAAASGAAADTPANHELMLSLQHAEAHRYQECVDAAKRATELDPKLAEAYNNLGFCYGSLGRWDEGIENVRKALSIKPDFPLANGNLSWMQAQKAKAGTRGGPK